MKRLEPLEGHELAIAGVRDTRSGRLFLATDLQAQKLMPSAWHWIVARRAYAQTELIRIHQEVRRLQPEGLGLNTQEVGQWASGLAEDLKARLTECGADELDRFEVHQEQFLRINDWVLEAERSLARSLSKNEWVKLLEENGAHAEVKALSDALNGLQVSDNDEEALASLKFYTERFWDESNGPDPKTPRPRCFLCSFITAGVEPTAKLAEAEADYHGQRR